MATAERPKRFTAQVLAQVTAGMKEDVQEYCRQYGCSEGDLIREALAAKLGGSAQRYGIY